MADRGRAPYYVVVLAGALLALAHPSGRAAAGVGPVVFGDGFESGDLCAWENTCPPPSTVASTWIGALDFAGSNRPIVLQLHQRGDGRLIGYVLGGTQRRTVVEGVYAAGSMTLDLEFATPQAVRDIRLSGTVSGQVFTGSASGDIAGQPVIFHGWSGILEERRLLFVDPAIDGDDPQEVAVVLREDGGLVAGGFASVAGCGLWACDGGVTSFSEAGDIVTIGLETDGGCSAGSQLTATFDPAADLYSGSYSFTSCSGTVTGSLIGARTTRTRTDHVAQALSALGAIADQFEAGTSFTAPHASFATDYLHNGRNLSQLFADWNAELAAYTGIEADVTRVRLVSTVDEPDAFGNFEVSKGVIFDVSRSGTPSGGGPIETYVDSTQDPLFNVVRNDLRVFEESSGQWIIGGDRQPALDLPWSYSLGSDGRLDSPTSGDPIHVAPGVFAAHFSPHTGHAYGDHKTDGVGFLPADDSEMDELAGDGVGDDDGVCEADEACAYWGGLDGSGVRDRNPVYLSRRDGAVETVLFVNGPTGVYFDDVPQWRVTIRYANGVSYDLDHVGSFFPAFASRVESATGCNPNAWSACGLADGTDLLDGLPSIPVAAGEPLCSPQMMADEVPGYPGYYVGGGSFPGYPWAQMEYVVEAVVDWQWLDICVYKLLTQSREAGIQTVLDTDMLDPASQRYALGHAWPRWRWAGEGRACNAAVNRPLDFSQLYSFLGGWYERTEPGTMSNEIFSYAPIAKDVAAWDPSLYDPSDPDALVLRQRARGEPDFAWEMPDHSIVNPHYPAGELLELTSDSMLIKWRDLGYGAPVYQRAAYLLDADGLKIKWGVFADTPPAATVPVLDPLEACDDVEVLCYDHEQRPGY